MAKKDLGVPRFFIAYAKEGSYAVVGLLARYDIDKHLSASVTE
nr:hypothetical protein [uncultured Pseudomonas sp.]